jgi:hypothetical protein
MIAFVFDPLKHIKLDISLAAKSITHLPLTRNADINPREFA